MKKLETKFTKWGCDFTQLERIGDVAIYERVDKYSYTSYEIVIVQSHNGREIGGKLYPPSEFFPSSATWGIKGWSSTTIESARGKFADICEAEKEKEIRKKKIKQ